MAVLLNAEAIRINFEVGIGFVFVNFRAVLTNLLEMIVANIEIRFFLVCWYIGLGGFQSIFSLVNSVSLRNQCECEQKC